MVKKYLLVWVIYGILHSYVCGQFFKETKRIKGNGALFFSFCNDNTHWYSSAGHGIFKWQNKKVLWQDLNFHVRHFLKLSKNEKYLIIDHLVYDLEKRDIVTFANGMTQYPKAYNICLNQNFFLISILQAKFPPWLFYQKGKK